MNIDGEQREGRKKFKNQNKTFKIVEYRSKKGRTAENIANIVGFTQLPFSPNICVLELKIQMLYDLLPFQSNYPINVTM